MVSTVSTQEPVEGDGSRSSERQRSGDQPQQQWELVPSLTVEPLRPVSLTRRYRHIDGGHETGGPCPQAERQGETPSELGQTREHGGDLGLGDTHLRERLGERLGTALLHRWGEVRTQRLRQQAEVVPSPVLRRALGSHGPSRSLRHPAGAATVPDLVSSPPPLHRVTAATPKSLPRAFRGERASARGAAMQLADHRGAAPGGCNQRSPDWLRRRPAPAWLAVTIRLAARRRVPSLPPCAAGACGSGRNVVSISSSARVAVLPGRSPCGGLPLRCRRTTASAWSARSPGARPG